MLQLRLLKRGRMTGKGGYIGMQECSLGQHAEVGLLQSSRMRLQIDESLLELLGGLRKPVQRCCTQQDYGACQAGRHLWRLRGLRVSPEGPVWPHQIQLAQGSCLHDRGSSPRI